MNPKTSPNLNSRKNPQNPKTSPNLNSRKNPQNPDSARSVVRKPRRQRSLPRPASACAVVSRGSEPSGGPV